MSRSKKILQHLVQVALYLTLALMLGFLAQKYARQWDLTQNTRHSLSQASIDILRQMHGPLTITAFAPRQDPNLGEMREIIAHYFAPYQRIKKDISLQFVDPSEDPKLAQAEHIRANGEMLVEFSGRKEHLLSLNEESVGNLFIRLSRQKQRLVLALSGHGERKLDGRANFDLGTFGAELGKKGFSIGNLNLAIAQEVPANASVLLITAAQKDLLPGEIDKISSYLDRGGNLLWLADQDPAGGTTMHGLQILPEKLDLTLLPGTIVDPAADKLRAPNTWALAAFYGNHPITRDFNLITAFPLAHAILPNEKSPWHVTALVDVAQNGWSSSGSARFDKKHDIAGPFTVAVALEKQQQRVVVVGSGEFLANSFIGNGGNMDFGINIVNWLTSDDQLISIRPRATIDSSLQLGKQAMLSMAIGLLIVAPLIFLTIAGLIAWRRRKG